MKKAPRALRPTHGQGPGPSLIRSSCAHEGRLGFFWVSKNKEAAIAVVITYGRKHLLQQTVAAL